ncbi:MAG: hypothetical protein ABSE40_01455 [Candidatus Sulfotelmatobacter sp.]|jgi:hypothetical protein
MLISRRAAGIFLAVTFMAVSAWAQEPTQPTQSQSQSIPYLKLTEPRHVLPVAQSWEGNQFPHTMAVLEMKRGGYRYWGWYGLNDGMGIGLARSNDLVNWTKYEHNPLWTNARWPSVLAKADPKQKGLIYFAITRDYDTPSSHIVLATSRDGIHLTEEKVLVPGVPDQRNQNPNLFHDPRSGLFYLTFYRGNDRDHFEIVSRSAPSVTALDKAPEKILMTTTTTVAAPTLLYLRNAAGRKRGVYYLATEIYPDRYSNSPEGEWQVEVFWSDSPDGNFQPVQDNPVMKGQRACLFQHVFNGRFYGYDCHLESEDRWILEEVEAPLP